MSCILRYNCFLFTETIALHCGKSRVDKQREENKNYRPLYQAEGISVNFRVHLSSSLKKMFLFKNGMPQALSNSRVICLLNASKEGDQNGVEGR